jgi:ABC-type multidrug transport system fused ATPase/permease subunit
MTQDELTPRPGRVPVSDVRRTFRLFRRFTGSRKPYVAGVLLLMVEAGTAVLEPWPIAYLVDYLQGARPDLQGLGFLPSARTTTILVLTVAIIALAAANSAADSLTEVSMARAGRSLGYSIRVAMYSHLQRLSLAYHDKRRTGDVLTRVTGDVLVVEDFVVKSVSNILGSLMVLVGSFLFLLYRSWNVALVALLVVPLLAVVSNHYSRRIKTASKTQRDREGDLASTTQEMLTSIRLVQSYGRGVVDLERFSGQTERSMTASLVAANIQARFSFAIALLEAFAISTVIWLGVWLLDRQAITVGTLVLFVLLLQNMFKPARKIVSEWYKVGKVFASVERIDDLLDREVVVTDAPDAVPAPPLDGRLAFRHVGFTYPVEREDGTRAASRAPVLKDIDFDVAPGEVVALVGPSGAGKSTIAQLVPRLYDADRGEVLVDGLPVRALTLASLREQVSVVLQDTVLLSGTVAENIGYGIADAAPEDIEAAARMANAHDFIMAMPDGYATPLGERGSTLSGGQRQRLAIARAFIRQAPILILDEPTTGLDRESADIVVSALRGLIAGTTTIVISHDPALVRCADRVLVISDGSIIEEEPRPRAGGAHARSPVVTADRAAAPEHGRSPAVADTLGSSREPTPEECEREAEARKVLLGPLLDRLPGLACALDVDLVGDHIQRQLLRTDAQIDRITSTKHWMSGDGTFTLRYQLQASVDGDDLGDLQVSGRVHRENASAEASLSDLEACRTGPWRRSTAVLGEAQLALAAFPVDPDLPTLPRAMDPDTLRGLASNGRSDLQPAVEVAHRPREGACVLRYRFVRQDDRPTSGPRRVLYGKVYADDRGQRVDGYLRALERDRLARHSLRAARFPTSVAYLPDTRLLVTSELAGDAQVPRLLRATLGSNGAAAAAAAELRVAVRNAGRALAALHSGDVAEAPVHRPADEVASLRRDLATVEEVWPDVAARVARALDPPSRAVPNVRRLVLSHGDFTPSQVLGLDGHAPAVLDLDTLRWADPAEDLGRYLAHVALLAARAGDPSPGDTLEHLAEELVAGYVESSARPTAVPVPDRIAYYMSTTLARSALNSCRQLKTRRLELALSLLESTYARG